MGLLRVLLPPALLCALVALGRGASAYPCHKGKAQMGTGVTCTGVVLPPGLCRRCPLRAATAHGEFVECWNTFATDAPGCLPAVEEYAALNPCDGVRAAALARLRADPDDADARAAVDYFLYAVCEQCCDCVPMGANARLFAHYAQAHSAAAPALYDPARGNCPAHAFYDICQVLPHVTHFTRPGTPPPSAAPPPACPLLKDWFHSPESADWQENPRTNLDPQLRTFLGGLLDAAQCADRSVWDKCFALEAAQNHLGVPEEVPEVVAAPAPEPAPAPAPAPAPSPSRSPASAAPAPAGSPTADPAAGGGGGGDDRDATTAPPADAPADVPADAPADAPVSPAAGPDAGLPVPPAPPARECFPGRAEAELLSGARVAMRDLRVGDVVRSGADGSFSRVYAFSHRDGGAAARFVRLALSSGAVLEVTAGHHLVVNGADVPAAAVRPGDLLAGLAGPVRVAAVDAVDARGLYNPHTLAGSVVVAGVQCSTYTAAAPAPAAHAILAPLRALASAAARGADAKGAPPMCAGKCML